MSRNFTDYATVPSLASRMSWNFTDCALTHPFDSRHVAELHGLRINASFRLPTCRGTSQIA
ncbi:hypothetical protein GmHk_14G041455 [Glycine max]|nr:hypothetical protein GmHk_14G041455 [Glycine max]